MNEYPDTNWLKASRLRPRHANPASGGYSHGHSMTANWSNSFQCTPSDCLTNQGEVEGPKVGGRCRLNFLVALSSLTRINEQHYASYQSFRVPSSHNCEAGGLSRQNSRQGRLGLRDTSPNRMYSHRLSTPGSSHHHG